MGKFYDQVVKSNVDSAIERLTQGERQDLHLDVSYTPRFLHAIRKKSVYAPSGARTSVKTPDLVVEQLILYAMRADGGQQNSLATPRKIELDFNARKNQAVVTVIPLVQKNGILEEKDSFTLNVKYDSRSGAFDVPEDLTVTLPDSLVKSSNEYANKTDSKPPSKKDMRAYRRKLIYSANLGLADFLNDHVFGLEYLTEAMEKDLIAYLDAQVLNNPMFSVIAGFPGNAKTELVIKAGEKLKLPVVKMNLQEYSGDSQEDAARFGEDLFNKIQEAIQASPTGKYILLLEELDKVHELDPIKGSITNRPVMAFVKDLLNEGHRSLGVKQDWGGTQYKTLDIRGAFTYVTMNFGVEIFDNIHADPRMTTINDMIANWQKIVSTPESLRKILSSMFLPETINRLMAKRFYVARPPREEDYRKIILRELKTLNTDMFVDFNSGKNLAGIEVKLTKSYIDNYIISEAVIPSEGGRQAAQTSRGLIQDDILRAIQGVSKSKILRNDKVTITLDYKPRTKRNPARVFAYGQSPTIKRETLFINEPNLRFPSIEEFGDMSLKRILVSGHEFGHAMAFVLTGSRFEYIMGVSPIPGAEGLVKERDINTFHAGKLISDLIVGVGSRAMERIMLSSDPTSTSSMLDTSMGPGADIEFTTKKLWKLVYQWGMDPFGGVIDRMGLGGHHHDDFRSRRVFFSELPNERVEQLSRVIRDLEDLTVHLFLQAHSREWYSNKIVEVARKGSLQESEFYELINYPFPGENDYFYGEELHIDNDFILSNLKEPASVIKARKHIQGNTQRTAAQNLQLIRQFLENSLKKHLHADVTGQRELSLFSPTRCSNALENK